MLQSPLTVTVANANGTHVLDVSDLEFSLTARGGFQAATFTFPDWVNSTLNGLAPLTKVKVHDSRTTRCVWEGYLDLPGRTISSSGQSWQAGAVGAASVLSDRSRPYIVIDRSLDSWVATRKIPSGVSAESGALPTNEAVPALIFQFPDGIHVTTGSQVGMEYRAVRAAGQLMGGLGYTWVPGAVNTAYQMQIVMYPSATAVYNVAGSTLSPTTVNSASVGQAAWTSTTENRVFLRNMRVSGGAIVIGDTVSWMAPYAIWVRSQRHSQTGAAITGTGSHAEPYLYAHWVVIDALWWFADDIIDIVSADIDVTWLYQIDQMAYPDGVRFADVLDDIALFEPDMCWTVGPSGPDNKHSFRLYRWATDVNDFRYETDSRDGFSGSGGEAVLANRLAVYWEDSQGKAQVTNFTAACPELDQWGRVRNAEPISLGAEIGSAAAAAQVGAVLISQLTDAPFAASLTVTHPIRDRYHGRLVQPWEIEPGELLNLTDVDGPPLRLTEVSYSDSNQAATLTLGEPTYTPEELIGKFTRQRKRPKS